MKPIHRQIYDHYRHLIDNNEITDGTGLPSVDAIRKRWGVSPRTVQRAVERLRADGYIDTITGSGATARRPQTRQWSATPEHHWWDQERLSCDATDSTSGPADDNIADLLEIPDTGIVVTRQYLIRESFLPVAIHTTHEPADLYQDVNVHVDDLSVSTRWILMGKSITSVEETVSIRPPTEVEEEQLELQEGRQVMEITGIYVSGSVPCHAAITVCESDRYRIHHVTYV